MKHKHKHWLLYNMDMTDIEVKEVEVFAMWLTHKTAQFLCISIYLYSFFNDYFHLDL